MAVRIGLLVDLNPVNADVSLCNLYVKLVKVDVYASMSLLFEPEQKYKKTLGLKTLSLAIKA